MSTRSNIGIKYKDGSVDKVYCHWDGYLSNNGQILLDNYKKDEVMHLIYGGDLSSLREHPDDVEFYGEDDSGATRFNSLQDYWEAVANDIMIEYAYIFDEDSETWLVAYYVNDDTEKGYHFSEFRELTQELIDRESGE